MKAKALMIIIITLGALVLYAGLILLVSLLVQFVWNGLASYFNFKGVTYQIAILITLAISILSGTLFRYERSSE